MSEVTLEAIENLLDKKLDEAVSGLVAKDDLVSEIRPLKTQLTSIEEKVDRIGRRSNEDTVASMKDLEKTKGRVTKLEEEVKEVKMRLA